MAGSYRIADEPVPGRLASLAVNPFWPFLGAMLAGFWLALPWFALNSAAMGSATRRREWAWLAGGAVVSAGVGFALFWAVGRDLVSVRAFRYALVGLVAWRLTIAYVVHGLQQASFELHRYFGGAVRNGAFLVAAAAFLAPTKHLGQGARVILAVLVG